MWPNISVATWYGLNAVATPQYSDINALIPNMMAFGGGPLGGY